MSPTGFRRVYTKHIQWQCFYPEFFSLLLARGHMVGGEWRESSRGKNQKCSRLTINNLQLHGQIDYLFYHDFFKPILV